MSSAKRCFSPGIKLITSNQFQKVNMGYKLNLKNTLKKKIYRIQLQYKEKKVYIILQLLIKAHNLNIYLRTYYVRFRFFWWS